MDENEFEKSFLPIGPNGYRDSCAKKFLFKDDYKSFVSQYNKNTVTRISKNLQKKYRNRKLSEIEKDEKNNNAFYEYLEFSKAYFSRDAQTAYIEVNYHSGGIYGDGTAFILRKNNGTWEIVQRINLWIT